MLYVLYITLCLLVTCLYVDFDSPDAMNNVQFSNSCQKYLETEALNQDIGAEVA